MSYSFSEITIEELPPQRVVCARVISPEPENDSIRTVQNWLAQHGLNVEGRRSFGFDVPVSPAESAAGLRGYEIGFGVADEVIADDGVQIRTYGGGKYAVMRVRNAFEAPFESIPSGWHHLMEWVEGHKEWEPSYCVCYEESAPGETGIDLILYESITPRG